MKLDLLLTRIRAGNKGTEVLDHADVVDTEAVLCEVLCTACGDVAGGDHAGWGIIEREGSPGTSIQALHLEGISFCRE